MHTLCRIQTKEQGVTEQQLLLITETVEWIVVGGLTALAVWRVVEEIRDRRSKGDEPQEE